MNYIEAVLEKSLSLWRRVSSGGEDGPAEIPAQSGEERAGSAPSPEMAPRLRGEGARIPKRESGEEIRTERPLAGGEAVGARPSAPGAAAAPEARSEAYRTEAFAASPIPFAEGEGSPTGVPEQAESREEQKLRSAAEGGGVPPAAHLQKALERSTAPAEIAARVGFGSAGEASVAPVGRDGSAAAVPEELSYDVPWTARGGSAEQAQALSNRFERDARRYDRAFTLYG